MSKRTGRHFPISYFRRLVVDLMYFSGKVPSVTIERRMRLGRLVAARNACTPRPSWSALFLKGYGKVSARIPELRTSYLKFPWPHFYEHPTTIASINIDRSGSGERVILPVNIRRPENRSLAELDAIIRYYKEEPITNIKSYRRQVALAKLPWPLRQFVWWFTLNVLGRRRCHNFGTFGITTVASQGSGVLRIIPLLTTTLHYGLFDAAGNLDMRLSLDHRVLDGMTAADVLADLEATLLGDVLQEVLGMSVRAAA
jgi:hypothetical protein